jgi:putative inorganic carbon (HCO3(-)) transporter
MIQTEARADTRFRDAMVATTASCLIGAAFLNPIHPVLAVGVACAPLAIIAASRQAYLLCVTFVVFSYFRIHEAFPILIPLRIPQLLAIATLAVVGWHVFGTRELKPFWSRELATFTGFFTLVTVGLVFAVNREMAFAYWSATYVKIGVMVLVIAWLTRGPTEFALASRAFVAAGTAISLVAISNKLQGIGLVEGTRATIGRNIESVLGDPNDLSLVLLFSLSFGLSLAVTKGRSLDRIGGAIAAVMVTAGIIATQSRGGLLGVLAVGAVFGSTLIRSKTVLVVVGTVLAIGLFAVAGISERASGGAHEVGVDQSSMGRLYAWGAAWHMALARPLTGVGLDNFVANYFFYTAHWDGLAHAVHSTWFDVLAATGFVGLIIFVVMVALVAASAFRSYRLLRASDAPPAAKAMSLALVAGIVGFCVAGTFLTQAFTWPIYIQLALTAAIARYSTASSRSEPAGQQT